MGRSLLIKFCVESRNTRADRPQLNSFKFNLNGIISTTSLHPSTIFHAGRGRPQLNRSSKFNGASRHGFKKEQSLAREVKKHTLRGEERRRRYV